ncbi:pyridoxal phosphate homeostasis protein [Cyclospora cayetanensis]|uniref:Pyridoxal phosphate homeostasis protein n=1 Tax=Cyclospora cayetanensis TaxID=88456 RepID=A0A6P6RX80_9EIME|nr:pyridoxal phosphate homeostasis protein [Cyclospora cayetanensis]
MFQPKATPTQYYTCPSRQLQPIRCAATATTSSKLVFTKVAKESANTKGTSVAAISRFGSGRLAGAFCLALLSTMAAEVAGENFDYVQKNIQEVQARIAASAASATSATDTDAGSAPAEPPTLPLLVAVSKTYPPAAVSAAALAGQQHFGENYVKELITKAAQVSTRVHWHLIGSLQTNKVRQLLHEVPSLYSVDSVDNPRLASVLQQEAAPINKKLRVLVQVNAGLEPQKSGVTGPTWPDAEMGALALATFIVQECPNLLFKGFMTVAPVDEESAVEAFTRMKQLKAKATENDIIKNALESRARCWRMRPMSATTCKGESLQLSMGMSSDMHLAIPRGSTQVRVGTAIFGPRRSIVH